MEIDETDELHVHERAFYGMPNLSFLKIYTKTERCYRWHLPRGFNYLPPKLRLLFWDCYPLRYMPSKFHPENLIKLRMRNSKLKKLGKTVKVRLNILLLSNFQVIFLNSFSCLFQLIACLKDMDLSGSENLKRITNLSVATGLETLNLSSCSSLTELTPSAIENLSKLMTLDMTGCTKLRALPNGINLQSLINLNLHGCSQLKSFPDISRNISQLILSETGIEKIPSNLYLQNLADLHMHDLKSKKLWNGVEVRNSEHNVFFKLNYYSHRCHLPLATNCGSQFVISFTVVRLIPRSGKLFV